jgi:hypothetical protein
MGLSKTSAGLVALSTVAAAALTLVPQTGSASTLSTHARATTNFGFFGQAFGSRVSGGALPANSGRTALAFLGCSRATGLSDSNTLANVDLGSLSAHGIKSQTRTYRSSGSVNVRSVNTIASVGNSGNALEIRGIKSVARTWHNATGFHRSAQTTVAGVYYLGALVPVTGNTVTIPGVATLTLNGRRGSTGAHGASMVATTVKVDLDATNSTVVLGNASAKISDGFVTGILAGQGIAAKGSVLNGAGTTGKVARQPLNCRGTNGVWKTNNSVALNVPNSVHLGAASGSARGKQVDRRHGYAQTRGSVARATLGSGSLVIKGIVGAANVTKAGTKLVKSAKGTHILSIVFNGRDVRIPTTGHPVRVGGLAVLSAPRAHRTRFGISVVALRVDLLGTTATLDLGIAKASIR